MLFRDDHFLNKDISKPQSINVYPNNIKAITGQADKSGNKPLAGSHQPIWCFHQNSMIQKPVFKNSV